MRLIGRRPDAYNSNSPVPIYDERERRATLLTQPEIFNAPSPGCDRTCPLRSGLTLEQVQLKYSSTTQVLKYSTT